jgi:hypothetical protein
VHHLLTRFDGAPEVFAVNQMSVDRQVGERLTASNWALVRA